VLDTQIAVATGRPSIADRHALAARDSAADALRTRATVDVEQAPRTAVAAGCGHNLTRRQRGKREALHADRGPIRAFGIALARQPHHVIGQRVLARVARLDDAHAVAQRCAAIVLARAIRIAFTRL